MSMELDFSTQLFTALKPAYDIKEASDKKDYYEVMGYEFKDDDKLKTQYSSNGEKTSYEDALEYAKAQIKEIEDSMPFDKYDGCYASNGKLNMNEIKYTNRYEDFVLYDGEDLLETLDLDGNIKNISAEEYASYIYTLDKLDKIDGKVDSDDLDSLERSQKGFKELVQRTYDENNKKEDKKSLITIVSDFVKKLFNK